MPGFGVGAALLLAADRQVAVAIIAHQQYLGVASAGNGLPVLFHQPCQLIAFFFGQFDDVACH